MFQCGLCHQLSEPREKAVRVVVETREVNYPPRIAAHQFKDADGLDQTRDDPGGRGREIVREVLAHEGCATSFHLISLTKSKGVANAAH